jgi:hypothetical protein
MNLISKSFCTVTLLTAGHSHLISADRRTFIRHINYSSVYIIHTDSHLLKKKLHYQRTLGRCYEVADPLCSQIQNNVHLGLGEYH